MLNMSASTRDDVAWAERCEFWSPTNSINTEIRRVRRPERKPIVLTGHGMRLHVENGALKVQDGLTHYPQKRATWTLFPGAVDLPNRIVVVDGSGTLSFDVLSWLSDQDIPLVRIDWTGKVATVIGNGHGPDRVKVEAQRQAVHDGGGLRMAIDLIARKVAASIETLSSALPPSPARELALTRLTRDADELKNTPPASIPALLGIEGRVAHSYFAAWQSLPLRWKGTSRRPIPEDWHRIGPRQSANGGKKGHNRRASHPVNAMLNYAYAILEAKVRIDLVREGYDVTIGCLHSSGNGRPALVFDMMEPLRPMVDLQIIKFISSNTFDRSDFLLTKDGVCRINPCVARIIAGMASNLPNLQFGNCGDYPTKLTEREINATRRAVGCL